MAKGKLIIITAPSGAGKTTLVSALVNNDDNLRVSVSYTTRPERLGEENGINYHFIGEKEFKDMLLAGDFLENATVYGHHYGTSQRWVNQQLNDGYDVILEIDWHGAAQVRTLRPDACFIFILPPSMAELERRLRSRATDSEDVIQGRMRRATGEIVHWNEYDYVLVNDDVETCLAEVEAIIVAERLRKHRRPYVADLARQLVERPND